MKVKKEIEETAVREIEDEKCIKYKCTSSFTLYASVDAMLDLCISH